MGTAQKFRVTSFKQWIQCIGFIVPDKGAASVLFFSPNYGVLLGSVRRYFWIVSSFAGDS